MTATAPAAEIATGDPQRLVYLDIRRPAASAIALLIGHLLSSGHLERRHRDLWPSTGSSPSSAPPDHQADIIGSPRSTARVRSFSTVSGCAPISSSSMNQQSSAGNEIGGDARMTHAGGGRPASGATALNSPRPLLWRGGDRAGSTYQLPRSPAPCVRTHRREVEIIYTRLISGLDRIPGLPSTM